MVTVMTICMSQISLAAYHTDVTTNDESSVTIFRNLARGEVLSEGAVEIGNPRDGSIFICIYTMAYRDVDRIFHTVFLEQWDEDDNDWIQLDSWSFEEVSSNRPNGLSMLRNSFTVTGYPWNKIYRVRGLHGVEYMDEIEACAAETDGLLITKD